MGALAVSDWLCAVTGCVSDWKSGNGWAPLASARFISFSAIRNDDDCNAHDAVVVFVRETPTPGFFYVGHCRPINIIAYTVGRKRTGSGDSPAAVLPPDPVLLRPT